MKIRRCPVDLSEARRSDLQEFLQGIAIVAKCVNRESEIAGTHSVYIDTVTLKYGHKDDVVVYYVGRTTGIRGRLSTKKGHFTRAAFITFGIGYSNIICPEYLDGCIGIEISSELRGFGLKELDAKILEKKLGTAWRRKYGTRVISKVRT